MTSGLLIRRSFRKMKTCRNWHCVRGAGALGVGAEDRHGILIEGREAFREPVVRHLAMQSDQFH